jgi:transposase-like protein
MVFEQERRYGSRWETIRAIAQKLGCPTEAPRNWVKRAEIDAGRVSGVTTEERSRIKDLEREISELRRANEILRKASAFFAQAELDRRPK